MNDLKAYASRGWEQAWRKAGKTLGAARKCQAAFRSRAGGRNRAHWSRARKQAVSCKRAPFRPRPACKQAVTVSCYLPLRRIPFDNRNNPSLTRTSRNQRGERDRCRMRRVEAANPSLTVGALSLDPEFSATFGANFMMQV